VLSDCGLHIYRIIDWGFARLLPLQFAVGFPRFLAIEPPQIDTPPPLDVVAFSSTFLQPSPVLQTDRQYFVSYLSSISTGEIPSSLSKPISLNQSITLVLSASDVDWRRLIFEAASSKGLHQWMVKRSWLLHDLPRASMVEEMESFLAGTVAQKSMLDRQILVDALKIKDNCHSDKVWSDE
jgi:hypothetical protein